MTDSIIALLPMKAHSERVPGKNFKILGEKPLFRWILDTLLSVEEIDRVIINTDARNDLTKVGLPQSDRLEIRDRRQELCGDLVSMNRIIQDDLDNSKASMYLMTHTTNPFVSKATIVDGIAKYRASLAAGSADSLFTVNKIQTRFYKKDGTPINHDPDELVRTQDLEAWYEENSCLYLFSKHSFSKRSARIGTRPMLFCTPRLESVDIDDADDWFLAECLAKISADRPI